MTDFYAIGSELNDVLRRQNDLLTIILSEQHVIRDAVRQKDWFMLDNVLYRVQNLSQEFSELENERVQILAYVDTNGNAEQDLYKMIHLFPQELRGHILETYRLLRQKLAVSKIENDSLNEYISTAKSFLQGIFDSVLPQSRNTVYSRSGVVKTQPESLVLDRLF